MDSKTIELLEFDKIRRQLMTYCFSDGGEKLLWQQGFYRQPEQLDEAFTLVESWRAALKNRQRNLSHLRLPDILFLNRLRLENSWLKQEEMALLSQFLSGNEHLRRFCRLDPQKESHMVEVYRPLTDFWKRQPNFDNLFNEIKRVLNPDGSIREDHPTLVKIKTEINRLNRQIENESHKLLTDNEEYWQTKKAAFRRKRTVLPLKASARGHIQGLIHDASDSGATLFIEPYQLVELNNRQALLQRRLEQEIIKLLKQLSEMIRPHCEELLRLETQLAWLDTFHSRARYATVIDGCRAALSERQIILKQARHPLLGSAAKPINLEIEPRIKLLAISGPNAGGKSVTLKTCGLLTMMNLFALPVPAAEGSALPLADNIFADIGDQQQIENALSSFTGHITRLKEILSQAGDKSLLLFDELGNATEPEQGSALALALLEHLADTGATTLITTHYQVIKQYAQNQTWAINCAMEFNQRENRPTYTVVPGLPGESHALAIAAACDIPPSIIENAQKMLGNGYIDYSRLIKELEEFRRQLNDEKKSLEKRERKLEEKQRQLDLCELRQKQQEQELLIRSRLSESEFIKNSRHRLEQLLHEIRSLQTGSPEKQQQSRQKINEFKRNLNERQQQQQQKLEAINDRLLKHEIEKKAKESANLPPTVGASVSIAGFSQTGRLSQRLRDDNWLVAVGSIKMELPLSKITVLDAERDTESRQGQAQHNWQLDSTAVHREPFSQTLDLRGMRLTDALEALQRQIDRMLLANITFCQIIHGHGDGILQQGVRDYLRQRPEVKRFDYARPEQGGYGKTELYLK